jgi:SAM-dependent methyltransferase
VGPSAEMTDVYAAMAAVYDQWQEDAGPFWELVWPKLLQRIAEHAPEARSFLELGCGTGSLLLALAEDPAWARLVGVDASAAMLAHARRKPGADRVRWVEGAFDSDVGADFDVAGSFFDALNHAAADGELARIFQAVARALRPGGLLIFDLTNRAGFEAWWRDRREHEGDDWHMTIQASFDPATGLARGVATVVTDQMLTPQATDVTERCFEETDVRGWLGSAGFTVIEASPWCPLPGDVPGKTWWVAQRT